MKRGLINRKGLSTIIVTLILIVISLAAIGVFWLIINNVIKNSSEQIGLDRFIIDAEIKNVGTDNSSNNVSLTFKRKAGGGQMTGIKFVFSDGFNVEMFTEEFTLKELEEKRFIFHLSNLFVDNLLTISIVPMIRTANGKETIGNILGVYNVKQGTYQAGNTIPPQNGTCVPTSCTLLGFNCGVWPNGTCIGTSLNCGSSCGTGYYCASGHCTLNQTVEPPTVNATPILLYTFEGNLNDVSGVLPALNGAWTNGTGTFSTGFDGQAANLAGIHGIDGRSNIKIGNLSELTISVYAKKNVASQGGDLIYKHVQYSIAIEETSITGRIYIGENSISVSGTANIDNTNWHQYTISYNGAALNLYVDGDLINSVPATGRVDHSAWQYLLIGHQPLEWSGSTIFNGLIDTVSIYNVSIIPPECSPGAIGSCALQSGVCAGSTQICDVTGHWPGCTSAGYLAYSSRYLAIEGPIGNPSCSDSYDNDCDGLTDGADSGCMNLYTINARTGEEILFNAIDIMKFYEAGVANWSHLYDWNFDDGISNVVGDMVETGAIGMTHYYRTAGTRDVVLSVSRGNIQETSWGGWEKIGYGSLIGAYHIIVNVQGTYSTAFELWHAPYHARVGQWIYARLDNDGSVSYDNDVTLDISAHPTYRMTATLTRDGGGYSETLFNADRSLNTEERFLLNNSKLPSGNYTLSVRILSSSGGSVVEQIDEYFEKPYSGAPTIGINEDNAFVINGQLFYPVTPWGLTGATEIQQWLPYINLLYHQGWGGNYNPSGWATYLNLANSYGLRAIGPERWFGTNYDGQTDLSFERNSNLTRIEEYVKLNKNNPGLFGWFWDDEPNLGGSLGRAIPEAVASWSYISKKYDSQHPTDLQMYGYDYLPLYTQWGTGSSIYDYMNNANLFGQKAFPADIIGFDIYPLEYRYHDALSNPTRGVFDLYIEGLETMKDYNYNLIPTFSFIEPQDLHGEDTSNPPGCTPSVSCRESGQDYLWTPGPTPSQLKMELWINVVHGLKGINYFHYFGTTPPASFVVMAEFLKYINDFTKIILATPTSRTLSDNSNVQGNRVDAMLRENSSDIYIFSVRVTEPDTEWGEVAEPTSISTTFNVGGVSSGTVYLYNESGRTLTLSGGAFTDTFNREAVHIYRIHK